MSAPRISFKEGDVYPVVRETFYQGAARLDLTGATVVVHARAQATGTLLFEDKAVTIDDAAQGEVSWQPTTDDTDTPGLYEYEYEVRYGGGNNGTVPSQGYYLMEVVDAIS